MAFSKNHTDFELLFVHLDFPTIKLYSILHFYVVLTLLQAFFYSVTTIIQIGYYSNRCRGDRKRKGNEVAAIIDTDLSQKAFRQS